MKARKINIAVALIILAALAVNSAAHNTGIALAGELFGWTLIVATLWAVVDKHIKERAER